MRGAIHPLPQYAFMAWCSVKKHRKNFNFNLLATLMSGENMCEDVKKVLQSLVIPIQKLDGLVMDGAPV
jgi:hypothetical protein